MSQNKKHVHAELMMQYARDALKTDEPWKMWERLHIEAVSWEQCLYSPAWSTEFKYRRKPEMIAVGKVSFPKPVDYELERGQRYHVMGILSSPQGNIATRLWGDSDFDHEYLQNGFIHLTKEAAQQHFDTLIKINKGEF
ncbi:hypothetical protein TI10_22345 [Photorhabdus luminescens subsp. luminescens]|uniref:Uncharacterized protein n=1 Tax=Photorhabdus luminescens TaxID=29488 RepID=A0A1G5QIJ9_PHOLU|nr:hypothetical protein [Photorhabdus luminescens]KMW71139.1 hypothetical protein TI10_22345 [Photorhabdus luminescens subsp. luminescens]SCZ61181.1 hypothetical protein SAMN02982990_01672 [Photorhabdus luminescens]